MIFDASWVRSWKHVGVLQKVTEITGGVVRVDGWP